MENYKRQDFVDEREQDDKEINLIGPYDNDNINAKLNGELDVLIICSIVYSN